LLGGLEQRESEMLAVLLQTYAQGQGSRERQRYLFLVACQMLIVLPDVLRRFDEECRLEPDFAPASAGGRGFVGCVPPFTPPSNTVVSMYH